MLLGWLRMPGEKLRRRHQYAGAAEAALQSVMAPERLLQIVQLARARAQALDRLDVAALRLHGVEQTRAHRATLEQNGAGAADAVLATHMRAVRMQHVPQEIGKKHARLGLAAHLSPVEAEANGDLLACARLVHVNAASRAADSTRPASTF